MVFQILLSTKRDAVPITRDFMIDFERAARARADGRDDADSTFHRPC
jgi:cyclopropane-fatty-acyl-phospholipid synthase